MSKEEYYNSIKNWVYNKFDDLEVIEFSEGNDLYLRYKNQEHAEIRIIKKVGIVYYSYKFSDKLRKYIRLERADFEILLKRWVKETFQIEVYKTSEWSPLNDILRLEIPFK